MIELWNQLAQRAGLSLSPEQHALLNRYLDLLLEANATMNLTRIEDRASAEVLHVGDALTILPWLPNGPHRLADVGSGGGVPGIPLAIARPDAEVTLIESTQKKAAFLSRAAMSLDLKNVKVLPERSEDVAQGPHRESFDVVVARGVAPMNLLVEWCLPLVKKGGKMLAMKGQRIAEEMPAAEKAVRILNGAPATIHPIELHGTQNYVVVEIPKLGKTDPRYPRPASHAKKKPL